MTERPASSPATGYRLDPLDRGVLGPLTRRQLVVLGSAALGWLGLSVAQQGMWKPLAVFAVAALVALPPIGGQPIVDWLPLWTGWMVHGRRDRHWVRPLHLTSATAAPTGPPLPAWLGGCRLLAHPGEGWAAVHDATGRTLTAHLQIAGTGFTTLAPDQMALLLSDWSQVFSTVPRSEGLARISWSDIARRASLTGHASWADEHTSAGDTGDYQRHVAGYEPMRHDLVLMVTLLCGSLSDAAAQREMFRRLGAAVQIVADALEEARLSVHGPLQPGEVAYLLRAGLDPTGVEAAGGVRPGSLVQRLGLVPVGAAGPMRTDVGTKRVEVDAVVHQVLWAESWPETPQPADWIDPLLSAREPAEVEQRIFTYIVEPVDDDKALAELRSAAARHGGEQVAAAQGRTRWDPFKARKANAVKAREEEVAGGAVAVGHTGLVLVTVRDGEALERAAKAVQRRFARRHVGLRPLWGRMDVGLAAVLPLGLGLSREPF